MTIVRATSFLLAGLLLFLAYIDPIGRFPFLLGAVFFGLLGYLSIRNAGAPESPFLGWSIGAVLFFYSLIGITDGAYPWRSSAVSLERDPILFWAIFAATVASGIGAVAYGITRKKHP